MLDTLTASSETSATPVDASPEISSAVSPSEENQISESKDIPKTAESTPKADYLRFAAIKRAERELRQKETQYKTEIEQLKPFASKYQEIESLIAQDPLKALEKLGLSYDKLSERLLQDKRPAPEKKLSAVEEKLAKLEAMIQEKEKAKLQEEEAKAQEQAKEAERQRNELVQNYKANTQKYIETQKDTYELLSLREDAPDLVFDTIVEYHRVYGKEPTLEQACEWVETYLFEDAKRYTNLKKIKALLQAETPAPKEEKQELSAQKKENEPKPKITTLSNKVVTEATHSRSLDELSEEERMARAIELLKRKG